MTRIRTFGLAVATVLAVSAVASGTASAHRTWWVNGEELANGEINAKAISAKTKAGTEWKLKSKIGGINGEVKCKTISDTGKLFNIEPTAGKHTGRDKGFVQFTGCTSSCGGAVEEPIRVPPELPLPGEANTLLAENKAGGTPIYDVFLPNEETSKLFTTIKFSGGLCPPSLAVESELVIGQIETAAEGEGGVTAEIVAPELSRVSHVFKFVCPPAVTEVKNWKANTVKVNKLKNEACFSGEAEVELVSKEQYEVK